MKDDPQMLRSDAAIDQHWAKWKSYARHDMARRTALAEKIDALLKDQLVKQLIRIAQHLRANDYPVAARSVDEMEDQP
jgi:hypothetical protein